jgi:FMN phosphatase YigB (HAD superfamily)
LINKNRTIVFDLDETLIHVSKDAEKSNLKIPVKFKDGSIIQLGVIYRPFLLEVLEKLSL